MSVTAPAVYRPVRRGIVRLHRWLGLGAAVFWMIQACTGVLLSFHFEIEDAALSTASTPTDPAAIEQRLEGFANAGGEAGLTWIWTSAGLPDRYVINFRDQGGTQRLARIDGNGDVLRDRPASDHTFLSFMRGIHIDLLSGRTGQLIMAVTGALLITNLVFGIIAAWPRRGMWKKALKPNSRGNRVARVHSWHRAIGLWGALPAMLIVATGVLMIFEHEVGDALGVHEVALPANPPEGDPVGFAAAAAAATAAIPGSRFVGTTFPSAADASYYAWVRAPGELYRGGYGGSLVIVDANDASIRGSWPVTEAGPAKAFVASFYPLHTGEAAGLPGRILALLTGIWLAATVVFGLLLWLRRRSALKNPARRGAPAPAALDT